MKAQLATSLPASIDCFILALPQGKRPPLPADLPTGLNAQTILAHAKGMEANAIATRSFSITNGKKTLWILLASTGRHKDAYALRQWVDKVIAACQALKASRFALDFDHTAGQFNIGEHTLELLIRRTVFAAYRFDFYKQNRDKTSNGSCLILKTAAPNSQAKAGLERASALAEGQQLARDLGNLAPNDCTVDYMHKRCEQLAKTHANLKLHLVDKKQMKKLGFGAFLAVGKGSEQDPRLVVLEYKHPDVKSKPRALLGKGLTFDSGGLSLKPASGMEEMKFDMCGAAAVIGACHAIGRLQPKIHALFAVALAENMPSHKATRPGDVITTLSGQTVEVLNTDAEGRLVLCDSLTYLQNKFAPANIVDIATLTGACVIALGHHASALYSNNQPLANRLEAAAEATDDGLWRMPLWREYNDQLASNLADLPNISGGRDAGSITAACFLSRFCAKTNWAHLDIAGTAWVSGKNKLATGRPAALLAHYLLAEK